MPYSCLIYTHTQYSPRICKNQHGSLYKLASTYMLLQVVFSQCMLTVGNAIVYNFAQKIKLQTNLQENFIATERLEICSSNQRRQMLANLDPSSYQDLTQLPGYTVPAFQFLYLICCEMKLVSLTSPNGCAFHEKNISFAIRIIS